MKPIRLCLIEMRRLLRKKSFWLIVFFCCLLPFLGVIPMTFTTEILSNKYIANPVLVSAAAGGILWALLTVIEASRVHRTGTDVLTDAVSSPTALPAARMAAQLILSAGAACLCMLIWIPYTAHKMEYLFSLRFYVLNYLILLLPSWWISMLMMESIYQFTRRAEAAGLIYALLCGCCLLPNVMLSYSLRWLCPTVTTYSDAFTTYWPLRVAAYSRVIWLGVTASLYLLSLMSVRKNQRGFLASFLCGCKNGILPALAAVLIACSALLGRMQPFVDHGKMYFEDRDRLYANHSQKNNLTAVNANYTVTPHCAEGTVSGEAVYQLKNNSGYSITDPTFSVLLNPGYQIDSFTMNGMPVQYEMNPDVHDNDREIRFTLPQPCEGELKMSYHGMPAQQRSNMPFLIMSTVDPDYVALYRTSALPMMLDILISGYGAQYSIILPENLTPFLDYQRMTSYEPDGNGNNIWSMPLQMDTIFNLQAGKYRTKQFEAGGIDVDFSYGGIYEDVVEKEDICGAVKATINYCTEHYGPIRHSVEDRLSLLQTSEMIPGGWASYGWSTWFEHTLTPETMSDSEKGASGKEVFMHEMIHQWWGELGVSFTEEELWSCEGMTVYSTYRLAKELYGEQYAKKYYVEKWLDNVKQQDRNFYNRHPEYIDKLPAFLRIKLDRENDSVNHYSRMALMLLQAERLLGGEAAMDEKLHEIYNKYTEMEADGDYNTDAVSFDDFLTLCGLREEELRVDENFVL